MDREDQLVSNFSIGDSFVVSGFVGRKMNFILTEALEKQRSGRSFWLVVPDLITMDWVIGQGINPSNVRLPNEFRQTFDWQTAHVGIFEDTNG